MTIIEEFKAHRDHDSKTKHPYPERLRAEAVAYFRCERARGKARLAIVAELGVHPSTMDLWRKEAGGRGNKKFVAVKVEQAARATSVVRIGAMQIEGLSIAEVAELIRAVG